MFSDKELKNLIVPLFLEQLLVALVGIADVFVVGFVGETAVSGVSLVNSFNTIFIYLFTALASVSLFTTICVRLVFSVLFGIILNLGVMGIAYAMCLDWLIRGIIFRFRFKKNKWKQFKVI